MERTQAQRDAYGRDGVADLIERLGAIPDEVRAWECDERAARLHYGLDEARLADLTRHGLPHRGTTGELRFEHGDLHCLGLRLGTATPYLWVLRRWARSIERLAARPLTRVDVEYVPQLPANAAPTTGRASLPDGAQRTVVLDNGRTAAETSFLLRGQWPSLPSAAARIVREFAAEVEFCPLPAAVRGDVALARDVGLADCMTAAHLLVADWGAEGCEGRVATGLLVSEPYSTPHHWPELRVDDAWVPVDPLMVCVMHRGAELSPEQWPPDRSIGPAVQAYAGAGPSLVADAGPVETTFVTAFDDAEAAASW